MTYDIARVETEIANLPLTLCGSACDLFTLRAVLSGNERWRAIYFEIYSTVIIFDLFSGSWFTGSTCVFKDASTASISHL